MKSFLSACVILVAAINLSTACECGLEGTVSRIFKGATARMSKYPWLAAIRSFEGTITSTPKSCAGVLIDDRHVLTAANCVIRDNGAPLDPKKVFVFLGWQTAYTVNIARAEKATSLYVHPQFNHRTLKNDFAIITLADKVYFNAHVGPVCLPNSENGLEKLTIAGWGAVDGSGKGSFEVAEAEVSFVPRDECNEIAKAFNVDKNGMTEQRADKKKTFESQMCAINKETKSDICKGDEGGPLTRLSDGQHFLMGIASSSFSECGSNDNGAGVYTRVHHFKNIIQEIAPHACWKNVE